MLLWRVGPPLAHKLAQWSDRRPATARLTSILGWAVASATACMAAPAWGQVAIEVALQSDYRVRGSSVSDREPVAAITLGYDDPSGFYAGGTAVGAVRHGQPGVVSLQGNIGYAKRISPDISLDAGLSRFEYFSSYGSTWDYHYTEVFLGVAIRNLAARIRYAPDYIRPGAETIYAEIDGGAEIAPNWLVSAHMGALQYLEERPGYLPQRRYDWRLGLTRRVGDYGLHLDLSGRLGRTNPSIPAGDRTALVASLTRAF